MKTTKTKDIIMNHMANVSELMEITDPRTEEYQNLAKLFEAYSDRLIELEKLEASTKETRFSTIMSAGTKALGVGAGAALAVWGTRTYLKFEENGVVGSPVGRLWLNNILPTKLF